MVDKVQKADCVGCKACGDICPKGAISFPVDNEGFWYPEIDVDMCVECGLCERVCPALKVHPSSANCFARPKTYKAYHKNEDIRYNSTSGALYYALAQSFIDRGGYIAGCVYNEGFTGAHHEISNTLDGLDKIMRSKYFQSDTSGIFKQIKSLLGKGESVLFCGTGCQVSGLYGYLGKNYDSLYTVELICRGINTPLAFTSYMDELREKFHSDITEVHFKNKSHGWTNLGTLVRFENGKIYYRNRSNDPWVNGFVVGNLYIRPCCENCKYKTFPRVADITIGDFWGLQFTEEEKRLGVSVALVNTEKGENLFMRSEEYMVVEEKTFEEAIKGNPALLNSTTLNPKRKEFFERIGNEPYSKVIWDLLGSNMVQRTAVRLTRGIKSVLRPIYRTVTGKH